MRRLTSAVPTQISRLSLDSLSFFLVSVSIIVNFFIFTQVVSQDTAIAIKAAFIPTFAMSGLLLRPIFAGGWNFKPVDKNTLIMTMAGGAAALGILGFSAAISPMATVNGTLFYVNMAIVEEVFFNYFLFAWICTVYPWPVAALLTGLFFAPFHIGVYGINLAFMAYAVIARIVLCTAYYASGSLSAAMIAHMAFNFIAVGSVIAP